MQRLKYNPKTFCSGLAYVNYSNPNVGAALTYTKDMAVPASSMAALPAQLFAGL